MWKLGGEQVKKRDKLGGDREIWVRIGRDQFLKRISYCLVSKATIVLSRLVLSCPVPSYLRDLSWLAE